MLEQLHKRFTEAKDVSVVQDLITEKQAENQYLDYKRVCVDHHEKKGWFPSSRVDLGNINRNLLSKAISGFGNAQGGIIVWGVDCPSVRRKSAGDVPQNIVLIEQPEAFVAQLEDAISKATDPAHSGGVYSRWLPDPGRAGHGVAWTYIPATDLGLMALGDEMRFYRRVGDKFKPMSRPDIEDMLRRGNVPRVNILHRNLILETRKEKISNADALVTLVWNISFINDGTAVALDFRMAAEFDSPNEHRYGRAAASPGWPETGRGTLGRLRPSCEGFTRSYFNTGLAPGQVVPALRCQIRLFTPPFTSWSLDIKLTSNNVATRTHKIVFSEDALLELHDAAVGGAEPDADRIQAVVGDILVDHDGLEINK